MKTSSTLLLAGAAAAYEYGNAPSSAAGYTTITPGGTYEPVTVTSQYQAIPTYVDAISDYSSYLYVSTVITDADGKQCTVTKTEEPVTVYHSKSTITHTATGGGAVPTAGYYPYNKNGTSSSHTWTWTELYEKICEVPYRELGPFALPGYSGSGLCTAECYGEEEVEYQPAHVKEYKGGKWVSYAVTYTYGAPTPKPTTYETPGIYTVPEYEVTVYKTKTVPAEGTYTAPAHKTVTYGGAYTEVSEPCTITAQYGAYETEGPTIKTIIKTTTIYAEAPGTYTIVKPTITYYEKETACAYPTAKVYPPGVYSHTRETVTITKSNEPYTCTYHSSSTYPAPTPTPSHTKPHNPDPSGYYEEPEESYGTPSAGYVKRGGMLERRKAEKKAAPAGKRVILV